MHERNNAVTTIDDVARFAKVSSSTVSRVINNHSSVKKSTRDKVLRAIKDLNFVPNSFARGLVNNKSNIIGLVIPTILNPFFGELVASIENTLYLHGFSVLLCDTAYDKNKQAMHIRNLIQQQADGIVIVSHRDIDQSFMQQSPKPPLLISIQSRLTDCDIITAELKNGMLASTEHLLKLGHRNISYICFDKTTDSSKIDGFISAFRKYGLPWSDEYISDLRDIGAESIDARLDAEFDVGYSLTKKLLESSNPPTAIQAMNDYFALGAYRAIIERGFKIPDDISVCGFDNIGIAKLLSPPLTTVDQYVNEQGKICGNLILQRFANDTKIIHQRIELPTTLVVRSSTAAPSV